MFRNVSMEKFRAQTSVHLQFAIESQRYFLVNDRHGWVQYLNIPLGGWSLLRKCENCSLKLANRNWPCLEPAPTGCQAMHQLWKQLTQHKYQHQHKQYEEQVQKNITSRGKHDLSFNRSSISTATYHQLHVMEMSIRNELCSFDTFHHMHKL